MKKLFIFFLMLSYCLINVQKLSAQSKTRPLFNGKNLDGWYSFLNSNGKNNDVQKVFLVEGGLLHISGKDFGYICTNKEYKNFHLVAEFKWGVKKYPPRDADSIKRDNGICYFVPMTAKDTVWPTGIEFQIQEGDVGDIWLINNATIIVDGLRSKAESFHRIIKKKNAEYPTGQWNRVELISNQGKIKYLVNGIVVNEGKGASLTKGKILIQSEGAEIYYRKIDIVAL